MPTTYRIDGTTVTQVVEHRVAEGITYPVVADPWLGNDLISRLGWGSDRVRYAVNVVPTQWGRSNDEPFQFWAHRDELRTKMGANAWRMTDTIVEQFYCHIGWNIFEPDTYNMESWRPLVNWSASIAYQCNP
ncbi:DUF2599 domain-containing protein [Arthrobacter sp. TMS2-4]